MASIDLLAVIDAAVRVMRCMPTLNWKAVRVVSPPTRDQMHTLVALQGARAVQAWRGDGPMVVVEAVDGDHTIEPIHNDCEFVGVTRSEVAATLQDQNNCSMRVRVVVAIIKSLMGHARFIVASRADGRGHVVNVGGACCEAAMRTNLVILFQRTLDAPFDDALKLHPVNCAVANHELVFVDVQFGSGAIRRMYVELTPGQVSGFAVDATKAVFREPPVAYGEISEHPGFAGDYKERFPVPGWGDYAVLVQKVCDVALSRELRQVSVDFVRRLL